MEHLAPVRRCPLVQTWPNDELRNACILRSFDRPVREVPSRANNVRLRGVLVEHYPEEHWAWRECETLLTTN